VGLAAIVCDVEGIDEGDLLELQVTEGILLDRTKGLEKRFSPLPEIMQKILNQGGLVNYIRKHGGFRS